MLEIKSIILKDFNFLVFYLKKIIENMLEMLSNQPKIYDTLMNIITNQKRLESIDSDRQILNGGRTTFSTFGSGGRNTSHHDHLIFGLVFKEIPLVVRVGRG